MQIQPPCCTVIGQSFSSGPASYSVTLRICNNSLEVTLAVSLELQLRVGGMTLHPTFTQTFHFEIAPNDEGELAVTFFFDGHSIPVDVDQLLLILGLAGNEKRWLEIDCGPAALDALKESRTRIAGDATHP